MAVVSNAAPSEKLSPHYVENKIICEDFARYIEQKNGDARGKYNAWSYTVIGDIPGKRSWSIRIKKAIFTNPSLILKPETTNLFIGVKVTANNFVSDCPDFVVRRRKISDFVLTPILPKWSKVGSRYRLKSDQPKHKLVTKILTILDELIKLQEVYQVAYKDQVLTIDLRSASHPFKVIDVLLTL